MLISWTNHDLIFSSYCTYWRKIFIFWSHASAALPSGQEEYLTLLSYSLFVLAGSWTLGFGFSLGESGTEGWVSRSSHGSITVRSQLDRTPQDHLAHRHFQCRFWSSSDSVGYPAHLLFSCLIKLMILSCFLFQSSKIAIPIIYWCPEGHLSCLMTSHFRQEMSWWWSLIPTPRTLKTRLPQQVVGVPSWLVLVGCARTWLLPQNRSCLQAHCSLQD